MEEEDPEACSRGIQQDILRAETDHREERVTAGSVREYEDRGCVWEIGEVCEREEGEESGERELGKREGEGSVAV